MSQREFYSTEAEQHTVGCLMLKPELCEEIGAKVQASDFYDADLRDLYLMILALHSKGIRPDAVSLSDYKPTVSSGEATMYLAGMIQSSVVSAANAKHYARIVMERALARRTFDTLQAMLAQLDEPGEISTLIAQWQQRLLDLSSADGSPDVYSYADILPGVIDGIDDRFNGKEPDGVSFGLVDLDAIIQKLRPGNLVMIAGKPGTGKTVLGTNLADKISIQSGLASMVFSLEMSKEELTHRSIAAIGGIDKTVLDNGKLSDDDWPRLTAATDALSKAAVRICDKPALTFSRLCNIARFEHRARKLSLIVIDYLTLIRPDANSRHANRSAEIGSFTRGLKALAKELGIPIVVLAQLNRAADGRADNRPRMTDLRDSGEIEQDADVVILGYRDEKSPEGEAGITEWDVAKCRHAKPGVCRLQFQGKFQRFVNAEKSDAFSYERSKSKKKSAMDDFKPGSFD